MQILLQRAQLGLDYHYPLQPIGVNMTTCKAEQTSSSSFIKQCTVYGRLMLVMNIIQTALKAEEKHGTQVAPE